MTSTTYFVIRPELNHKAHLPKSVGFGVTYGAFHIASDLRLTVEVISYEL